MIVLGVVLLVMVVVFAVAVVVSNPDVLNLYLFNALVPVTMGGVFFTGAVALLIMLVATLLIHRGIARTAKLRRQQRALAGAPSTAPAAPLPTTSQPPAAEPAQPRAAGSHAVEPATPEPALDALEVSPPSAPATTATAETDGPTRDDQLR